LEFDEVLPTTRPAAAIVLDRKHDGTNGYILSLLTTGIVRLQINGFNFDSTVALASATNVNPKLQVPVIRETATVAGSVTFYSNGVILGTAVAIAAHGDLTTDFLASQVWTALGTAIVTDNGGGSYTFDRNGSAISVAQSPTDVAIIAGATYEITFTVVSATPGSATLGFTIGGAPTGTALYTAGTYTAKVNAASATSTVIVSISGTSVGVYTLSGINVKRIATINNTSARIINGTTTTRTAGSLQASRLFNRALTSAEVLDLSINGPALADRGASQTPVYESDFSAGVDGATGTRLTIAGNIDGIGGEDNWLRGFADTTNSSHIFTLQNSSGLVAGVKYRLSFKYFIPSANTTVKQLQLISITGAENSLTAPALHTFNVTDAATSVTVDFTMGSVGGYNIRQATSAGAAGFIGANSVTDDLSYIKDVVFTRLGLTSELLASNAQSDTGQIFDTSGNKNHALLPASGATVVGRPVSQTREVRWTNTWAGTNELQYIGGVNQAILPANAYIESIVGTVSGATPHDIIIGDGSDTDRYVTITTGLAAGTTSFTLANQTTDGTNLKLTVDPDTDATMSIAWVISYKTLES
jgi:hypothetical protein